MRFIRLSAVVLAAFAIFGAVSLAHATGGNECSYGGIGGYSQGAWMCQAGSQYCECGMNGGNPYWYCTKDTKDCPPIPPS